MGFKVRLQGPHPHASYTIPLNYTAPTWPHVAHCGDPHVCFLTPGRMQPRGWGPQLSCPHINIDHTQWPAHFCAWVTSQRIWKNNKPSPCRSVQATIIKHHRLGDLNNRNSLSHSSGGWKPGIRTPARSGEGSVPGLQTAAFSLYPPGLSSSSFKGTYPTMGGPTLMASPNLITSQRPISKSYHIGGQGFNIRIWEQQGWGGAFTIMQF